MSDVDLVSQEHGLELLNDELVAGFEKRFENELDKHIRSKVTMELNALDEINKGHGSNNLIDSPANGDSTSGDINADDTLAKVLAQHVELEIALDEMQATATTDTDPRAVCSTNQTKMQ